MGLSSAGIGSNLPVDSIVSQLMAVEQRPLAALDKKVSTFQSKLSALGTLKSALATFQTAVKGLSEVRSFALMTATMSDTGVASATAGTGAAAGTYSLEVSKLAQAQKLASAGQASSTAAIGAGTITFDLGSITGGSFDAATGKYSGAAFASSGIGAKTVIIDPANTSLAGIRDAINKAGVGVTASIVNDGSATPNRLMLTQTATGAASSMKISVDGDPDLQALLNHDPADVNAQALKETVSAQNAEFKLDGLAISSATNNASGVIDGVTLNLNKTNAGTPATLILGRDTAAVVASVTKFSEAYNAITKTLKDLTAYNETTKTGAVLNGDATARTIQSQLRGLLTAPVVNGGSAFSVLSEIGVTVKAGVMAVDEAKLKKTIDSNFEDISALFASVGKPTDSLVSFKSATDKTVPGAYAVNITQLASKGSSSASAAAGLTITASNRTLEVTLDGKTTSVSLAEGIYDTPDALAREVQSKINGTALFSAAGSGVTVSQNAGKLVLTSNRYGSASDVSIAADAAGTSLMGAAAASSGGVNVAGTIGGLPATGAGRTLTAGPGAAEGLSLTADGLGARGTINYSQGYAHQFDRFTSKLLDTDGPLTLRSDGINASIKQLTANRLSVVDRLAEVEKRFRTQYTTLDTTISRMNSTSAYLAQQLAQLSKML